jgi:C1A family cysteine protease
MTCVSWATGYAAYTILCGVANNQKVPAYSGIFLAHHLHRETNYDKGMSISKALDTLKKYGTVADAFYTHDMKAKPKSNQVVEAATHKISHYDKIFDYQKEDKSLLVEKLKQAIEQRRPIIIGFEIDDAFADDKVVLWKGFSTLNAKKYNHAVCVIGYDNSKDNGKGAFEIMNSWGDKWSDKGFGWISYEAITKHCLAAFTMKQ